MSDKADEILNEIVSIAQSLGMPVEIDRPYDIDESELPLVIVRSGDEETIDDGDMPQEAWDITWRMSPAIEVLVPADDPLALRDELNTHWATLRGAVAGSSLLDLVRGGSRPAMRKEPLTIDERPGIAGFAVEITVEFERD